MVPYVYPSYKNVYNWGCGFQHLYCTVIRTALFKEVNNCYTCQHTKRSNTKYGKLTAKEYEEIPQNKLFVDIIGLDVMRGKGNNAI